MKRLNLLVLIFSLTATINTVLSQPSSWTVASILPELRKDANVVKRYESISLTVEDISNATLHVKQVFTALNEKGRFALAFHQYTTKYITLKDVDIKLYDSTGKQLNKYKKKDLQMSAIGEGLVEDGQVVFYIPRPDSYPATAEFEYEVKMSGTLNLPSYDITQAGQSVEESYFIARVPSNIGFRWLADNTNIKPVSENAGSTSIYKFDVSNISARTVEAGAPSRSNVSIMMTLNRFSFYGNEGELSSWKSFGQWLSKLYTGVDELPVDRRSFFEEMVSKVPDDISKAKLIYEYMQRNFRYVSIQLGVGGLKPFSATFTDQKKYGDCKGLSNFMKAALASVGIKSYLAIINAGHYGKPVDPDFPINQFNHCILCIPRGKDSIWLECTSSTAEFGQLGTFTENRNALLITENGGQLVRTPASDPQENIYSSNTKIELAEDGSGISETIFNTTGYFREMLDYISKQKKDDQKESIIRLLSFKQPDEFEFIQHMEGAQQIDTLLMSIEKIHEFKAGNKFFLPQRIYKIWSSKLPAYENRKQDYFFSLPPFELRDTTRFIMPQGYKSDVLPDSKKIQCEFGTYSTAYWFNEKERTLYTSATLLLRQYQIPASKYTAFKKFFDDIMSDEEQRVVIKNEQGTKGF